MKLGARTCGVCNATDIPRGIDWPWWSDGKPVHLTCHPDFVHITSERPGHESVDEPLIVMFTVYPTEHLAVILSCGCSCGTQHTERMALDDDQSLKTLGAVLLILQHLNFARHAERLDDTASFVREALGDIEKL